MLVISILTVTGLILNISGFWKKKAALNVVASVLCIIASIFATILIDDAAGKNGAAYIYYVNGVRMSDGFASVSDNFMVAFALFAVLMILTMGLGAMVGVSLRNNSEGKRPSRLLLAFSIIFFILGFILLGTFIPMFFDTIDESFITMQIMLTVAGVIVFFTGLFGIIKHIKLNRKYKRRMEKTTL